MLPPSPNPSESRSSSLICPDEMWIVSGPRNVRGRWRYSGDDDEDGDEDKDEEAKFD
jgi:hypothetical protein